MDDDAPDPEVWPGRCSRCGGFLLYSETYDARFCKVDDLWAEGACGDPRCDFCAVRPLIPALASDLREEDPLAEEHE